MIPDFPRISRGFDHNLTPDSLNLLQGSFPEFLFEDSDLILLNP